MTIAAYVVNRPQDTDRLRRFRRAARGWDLDIRVIAAVDGHAPGFSLDDYPAETRNGWNGMPRFKIGAFACFLSHRLAWTRIAEGDDPHAFVCEDDAVLRRDPEQILPLVGQADLAYANRRMATWVRGRGPVPLETCIATVINDGRTLQAQGAWPTFGGDCYWLSRDAARALLDQFDRHGICGGVDFFVASVALPRGVIPDPLPAHLGTHRPLSMLGRIAGDAPLRGVILGKWLSETKGDSVLGHGLTGVPGRAGSNFRADP